MPKRKKLWKELKKIRNAKWDAYDKYAELRLKKGRNDNDPEVKAARKKYDDAEKAYENYKENTKWPFIKKLKAYKLIWIRRNEACKKS